MTAGSVRQDGRQRKRRTLEVKAQQHGKVMLALHFTTFHAVSKLRVKSTYGGRKTRFFSRLGFTIKSSTFKMITSLEFVTKSSASVFLKLNQ